jgi:hypothetical protein
MGNNGVNLNGNPLPIEERTGISPDKDSALVLDDRLNAAAAPVLHLLTIVLAAVAVYLLYSLLHG